MSNAVGVGTINRFDLFDALREFINLKGVNETRIFPDRVVVYRLARDGNGDLVCAGDDVVRTVETYWLTAKRKATVDQ